MRCSHCYGKGHNKTTCPDRLRKIQMNPNGYEARMYSTQKESRRKENMQCSYCETIGHTRRTCTEFKSDVATLVEADLKWRKSMLSHMRDSGFGPGALVKKEGEYWSDNEYKYSERLVLIQSFGWDKFHFGGCLRSSISRDIGRFVVGSYVDASSTDNQDGSCNVPIIYAEYVDENGAPTRMTKTKDNWSYSASSERRAREVRWQIVSPLSHETFDSYIESCGDILSEKSSKQTVMNYMNDDPHSSNANKKRTQYAVSVDWRNIPWANREKK